MSSIKSTLSIVIDDDAVATAANVDSLGNIWVAGVIASTPPSPSPKPTSTALNPDNVQIDTPTVIPSLSTLSLWKFDKNGTLIAQYKNIVNYVIYPREIIVKGKLVTVRGEISTSIGDGFQVTFNGSTFSAITPYQIKIKDRDLYEVRTKLSLWKSYTTSKSVAGISWKPTKPTRVLIRTSLKTGAVASGYVMSGDLLSLSWVESAGIILLRHDQSGYVLTILK